MKIGQNTKSLSSRVSVKTLESSVFYVWRILEYSVLVTLISLSPYSISQNSAFIGGIGPVLCQRAFAVRFLCFLLNICFRAGESREKNDVCSFQSRSGNHSHGHLRTLSEVELSGADSLVLPNSNMTA